MIQLAKWCADRSNIEQALKKSDSIIYHPDDDARVREVLAMVGGQGLDLIPSALVPRGVAYAVDKSIALQPMSCVPQPRLIS